MNRRSCFRLVSSACALLALWGCDGDPVATAVASGEVPRPASLEGIDSQVVGFIENGIAVIEENPDKAFPRAGLAMIYQAHELFEPSRIAYRQALSIEPENARWLYHLSEVEWQLDDADAAIAAISRSIELEPRYAPSYRRRSGWLSSRGDAAASEEDSRKAVAIAPEDPTVDPWTRDDISRFRLDFSAYVKFVEALATVGQLDRALDEFQALLQSRPDDARLLLNVGRTYTRLGRHEESLATLERGIELHPRDPELLSAAAMAHRALDRPESALELLDRALQITPQDGLAHARRGAILHGLERYPEAGQALAQALKHRPRDTQVMLLFGDCLDRMRQYEAAAEMYRRALALDDQNADLLARLGLTLHRLGNFAAAESALVRALQIEPDNSQRAELLEEWRREGRR